MGALSEFRLMRPASAADAMRLRSEFPASRFIPTCFRTCGAASSAPRF